MEKKLLLSYCLIFVSIVLFAQNDTVNQKDRNGKKQAYWRKNYKNGNIAYEGYFKDNEAIGEFKRYHKSGKVGVLMFHKSNGVTNVEMFDERGVLMSKGKYINKQKDSIWTYYDYEGKFLAEEKYILGKREGLAKKYYKNGFIAEEQKFKNDKKNGIWRQYYQKPKELGTTKMETIYKEDKLDGIINVFYLSGQLEIKGKYKNNKRIDKWTFFKEDGTIKKTIEYDEDGVPLNKNEVEASENKILDLEDKEYQKNRFKLKELDRKLKKGARDY